LVLCACEVTAPTQALPSTSVPASVPASTQAARLADTLRDAVDIDHILNDLAALQDIADEHAGNRAAGTAGYAASAAFVAEELRRAGFAVDPQPVTIPAFRQEAPSHIEILATGGPSFEDLRDFKSMIYSASGDVTASVVALGFDPTAQPGDRGGIGCDAADWAAVPPGAIALVQPAPCPRHDVVVQAQAAGALAVVTSYADWAPGAVRRPTLVEPDDIRIPVLGSTHAVGLALAQAALDGTDVHITTASTVDRVTQVNVIGETARGDADLVVMLGAHLDSVVDGPGINDNGSGAMAILEIARELAVLVATTAHDDLRWKVRVAFWTGEELGLLGSAAYVRGLGTARDGPIRAYLNFDMLGSPNGIRVVYDGAITSRPPESTTIGELFTTALAEAGLASELQAVGAASDNWPMEQAGIPIGGLFSGAGELKSAEQASLFGGTADIPADACYHLACDTIANVDPILLEQLARAAAWVVGALASGEVTLAAA
jgi:Zn-dependent M28 family amino/carboxypeptidase